MTNLIFGIIIGFILSIVAIFLLGYILDRVEYKRVRKDLGEDFEVVYMTKSEIENLEKSRQ